MATNLTQTTLSTAINQNATMLNVASATNIVAPGTSGKQQKIYVIDPGQQKGELMLVTGAATGTQVPVTRLDQFKASHSSGSIVIMAPIGWEIGEWFFELNPSGNPTVTGSYPGAPVATPYINIVTGEQFLAGIGGQWVAGWNTPGYPSGVTVAVASAAGLVTPSGPLFHVTGTAAITGFNIPVGFAGGSFTVIPDAIFTWTAANNIGLAGTAVVGKALTFTYDANSTKFYPNYIA